MASVKERVERHRAHEGCNWSCGNGKDLDRQHRISAFFGDHVWHEPWSQVDPTQHAANGHDEPQNCRAANVSAVEVPVDLRSQVFKDRVVVVELIR